VGRRQGGALRLEERDRRLRCDDALRVTGTKTEDPGANWSLSGILVRNPASTHSNENWLAFRTGWINGSRV
jgi:hypothetical protein